MPLKERLYKNPTSTYLETHLNLNLKIQHYQLVNSVFTAKILGKEKKKKKGLYGVSKVVKNVTIGQKPVDKPPVTKRVYRQSLLMKPFLSFFVLFSRDGNSIRL